MSEGLRILESKRAEIARLCQAHGVVRLLAFGSAVRDDFSDTSDFDLAAEYGWLPEGLDLFRQHFGLLASLEESLGRKVDLIDCGYITKDWIRETLGREGVAIYAAGNTVSYASNGPLAH